MEAMLLLKHVSWVLEGGINMRTRWTEWQQDATAPRDDVATMLARSPAPPQ